MLSTPFFREFFRGRDAGTVPPNGVWCGWGMYSKRLVYWVPAGNNPGFCSFRQVKSIAFFQCVNYELGYAYTPLFCRPLHVCLFCYGYKDSRTVIIFTLKICIVLALVKRHIKLFPLVCAMYLLYPQGVPVSSFPAVWAVLLTCFIVALQTFVVK